MINLCIMRRILTIISISTFLVSHIFSQNITTINCGESQSFSTSDLPSADTKICVEAESAGDAETQVSTLLDALIRSANNVKCNKEACTPPLPEGFSYKCKKAKPSSQTFPTPEVIPLNDSISIYCYDFSDMDIEVGCGKCTRVRPVPIFLNSPGQGNVDKALSEMFKIFPNPASSYLNLQFYSNTKRNVTLKLYNIYGQGMDEFQLRCHRGKNEFKLDIKNLSAGLYSMTLDNIEGNIHSQKIVIQNGVMAGN